jgi:hypothetical protein
MPDNGQRLAFRRVNGSDNVAQSARQGQKQWKRA